MPSKELAARIGARWPLTPLKPAYRGEVAERYAFADGAGEVGFISSVSQPFCGDCSRARLSSDGVLYTCLFATHGTSLRDALRGGASDDALLELIRSVWLKRADRYSELRASLTPRGARASARSKCSTSVADGAPQADASDAANRPTMVDVGAKEVTQRTALAEARVRLPRAVARRCARAAIAPRRARCSTPPSSPASWPPSAPTSSSPSAIRSGSSSCQVRDRARSATASCCVRCRGERAPPHRRRDGGAHRGERRRAHRLRHVQGAVARHRDRRRAPAGEVRRPRTFRREGSASADGRAALRPGARRRPQHAHGRGQGGAALRGPHAARARHGAADAARGARLRVGAPPIRARIRCARASRRSTTASRTSARSPASSPRRRVIPRPPGWCSPAICRCSMQATLAHLVRARDPAAPRHRLPLQPRRPARAAVRDLRAAQPRAARAPTSPRAATARASSCCSTRRACSRSPIRARSTTSTRPRSMARPGRARSRREHDSPSTVQRAVLRAAARAGRAARGDAA